MPLISSRKLQILISLSQKTKKQAKSTGAIAVLVFEKIRKVVKMYTKTCFFCCNNLCFRMINPFVKMKPTRLDRHFACIFHECRRMQFVLTHRLIRCVTFSCFWISYLNYVKHSPSAEFKLLIFYNIVNASMIQSSVFKMKKAKLNRMKLKQLFFFFNFDT